MEEEGCHSHDDATPLSFWLQVTEDFLKIFLHVLCNFSHTYFQGDIFELFLNDGILVNKKIT